MNCNHNSWYNGNAEEDHYKCHYCKRSRTKIDYLQIRYIFIHTAVYIDNDRIDTQISKPTLVVRVRYFVPINHLLDKKAFIVMDYLKPMLSRVWNIDSHSIIIFAVCIHVFGGKLCIFHDSEKIDASEEILNDKLAGKRCINGTTNEINRCAFAGNNNFGFTFAGDFIDTFVNMIQWIELK